MSNPVQELIAGGMSGIEAYLTMSTCGEACWHAREVVCRCSCGGKNHGCLLGEHGERPERTARIDGFRYKLAAVGQGAYEMAEQLNKAGGGYMMGNYSYPWRDSDRGAPARIRIATDAQVKTWPELASFREQTRWDRYKNPPRLCWQRID